MNERSTNEAPIESPPADQEPGEAVVIKPVRYVDGQIKVGLPDVTHTVRRPRLNGIHS